ncbi:DNA methyltransferase [Methylocaldum sp.]|uniref:DNA methyltransferase n=1 Tax=Methylocaldum sp. TaxID=1969727 RepID=UPI002D6B46A2|nr:DNA methyltransferase [Methylocaldum sp.]HYE38168.1 DNA methyltransferase [Methylocaldum sp.]
MTPLLASEIIVRENRQRQTFDIDKITELSESIQRNGLMHPIVVRRTDEGFVLVAGERRLKAMQMLIDLDIPVRCGDTLYTGGTVPNLQLGELSPEQAEEAELEENIRRVDLTWQEKAAATARLHLLRSKQADAAGQFRQTLAMTAAELIGDLPTSNDVSIVKENLIIAQHLDDPDVVKAPTQKEALKVIEKKAKAQHRAELAKKFDLTKSPHRLIHANSLEYMADSLGDEVFDCLLTDPPYGVDASNFGSNFSTLHEYEDGWEYFLGISRTLSIEAFRVLKPNTHAYVFCSFEGFSILARDFTKAGFKVWPQPLIWAKGNGNAPWVSQGHKRTYECIMFASKGTREMNVVKADVLVHSPVSDREHGAEKPVPLLVDLLQRSVVPGDKILDPFAGSGSIFPAASAVSCVAVGIEREEASFNLALTKLEN